MDYTLHKNDIYLCLDTEKSVRDKLLKIDDSSLEFLTQKMQLHCESKREM